MSVSNTVCRDTFHLLPHFLFSFFFQPSSHLFPSGAFHRLVRERCFPSQVRGSDAISVFECIVTLSLVVSNSFFVVLYPFCQACLVSTSGSGYPFSAWVVSLIVGERDSF